MANKAHIVAVGERTIASPLSGQSIDVVLSVGNNLVPHTLNTPVRHATFFGEDGWNILLSWKPTPGGEDKSITVYTGEEYTGVTVNVQA